MILNSDLIMTHPLWERADLELCNRAGYGIFNRLIDVFVLACAIGIKDDQCITDIESPLDPPKSIGRNTYQSLANTDLKDLLEFMLQNAILNTSMLKVDQEERIKLAFDPDYTLDKINAAHLLVGFANYGIEQIFAHIDSKSNIIAIDELHSYFEEIADSQYDDLVLQSIAL